MALAQKQISSKKQTLLTLVMLMVIGITAAVAYFGYFRQSHGGEQSAPAMAPDAALGNILKVQSKSKSGLEMLESLSALPAWQRLKKFGRFPLPLEPRGNPEPFRTSAKEPAQ